MFSKRDDNEITSYHPTSSGTNNETIIGPTVRVEGTFTSEDSMRIEGQVNGTITTTQDITIGKEAKIEADIEAANMIVHGEVRGNLQASGTIQLGATAKVIGNITTHVISIETGATLQGQCTTQTEKKDDPTEKTSSAASQTKAEGTA